LEVSKPERREDPLAHAGAENANDEKNEKNRGNPELDKPRIEPTSSGE
jgi:hypothetical protein